jgi:hypothetical protein
LVKKWVKRGIQDSKNHDKFVLEISI